MLRKLTAPMLVACAAACTSLPAAVQTTAEVTLTRLDCGG